PSPTLCPYTTLFRSPWTLRDIVDYELSAVRGLLRAADLYREDLVSNFYAMGRRAVDAGRKGTPFAYVIPPTQYDVLAAVKLEQRSEEHTSELQSHLN